MGWHGVALATHGQLDATPENFLAIFYYCFIFVAMERSKILVDINLGLCNIQGNSIFSCIHLMHYIVITEKYEKSSQILHHVTPPVKLCHP